MNSIADTLHNDQNDLVSAAALRATRVPSARATTESPTISDAPPVAGHDPSGDPSEVTRLLHDHAAGRTGAADRLATVVYGELHTIAAAAMRREQDGHTWQPTDLVHEAFVRLLGQDRVAWRNRHHFFGVAAQAMRRLLVDHARARKQLKRDGGERITLTGVAAEADGGQSLDLLALNNALDRLAERDQRQVRIVELRYFAGFSVEETAVLLGLSEATIKRDWAVARAFLRHALSDDASG